MIFIIAIIGLAVFASLAIALNYASRKNSVDNTAWAKDVPIQIYNPNLASGDMEQYYE